MIEEDDATTEAHHLGAERSIVSDQDCSTVEYIRRVMDELDRLTKLREPEILDGRRFGMSVTDNGPAFPLPAWHAIKQDPEVVAERRNQFWDHGRYVTQRFPMECDGHRSTLVLTPYSGVPRVKLWDSDSDGNVTITPGPSVTYFIVGCQEQDDVPVLFSDAHWAVERRYAGG